MSTRVAQCRCSLFLFPVYLEEAIFISNSSQTLNPEEIVQKAKELINKTEVLQEQSCLNTDKTPCSTNIREESLSLTLSNTNNYPEKKKLGYRRKYLWKSPKFRYFIGGVLLIFLLLSVLPILMPFIPAK